MRNMLADQATAPPDRATPPATAKLWRWWVEHGPRADASACAVRSDHVKQPHHKGSSTSLLRIRATQHPFPSLSGSSHQQQIHACAVSHIQAFSIVGRQMQSPCPMATRQLKSRDSCSAGREEEGGGKGGRGGGRSRQAGSRRPRATISTGAELSEIVVARRNRKRAKPSHFGEIFAGTRKQQRRRSGYCQWPCQRRQVYPITVGAKPRSCTRPLILHLGQIPKFSGCGEETPLGNFASGRSSVPRPEWNFMHRTTIKHPMLISGVE